MSRYGVLIFCLAWLVLGAGPAAAVKVRHLSTVNSDALGGRMLYPTGIACGGNRLLVADSGNGRLLSGAIVEDQDISLEVIKDQSIQVPISAVRLSTGDYLVLDGKSKKIGKFNGDNLAFLGFIDLQGTPDPPEIMIKALAVDASDQIYLLDTFNGRILVVDAQGQFLRHIVFPENSGFISDVAVAESGAVYLLASVKNQVFRAASGEELFQPLGSPQITDGDFITGLTSGQTGLILLDRRQGRIVVAGFDGNFLEYKLGAGYGNGQLRYPSDICLDSKQMFIADQGNNRIQVFEIQH